jgi:hypothetical protein
MDDLLLLNKVLDIYYVGLDLIEFRPVFEGTMSSNYN